MFNLYRVERNWEREREKERKKRGGQQPVQSSQIGFLRLFNSFCRCSGAFFPRSACAFPINLCRPFEQTNESAELATNNNIYTVRFCWLVAMGFMEFLQFKAFVELKNKSIGFTEKKREQITLITFDVPIIHICIEHLMRIQWKTSGLKKVIMDSLPT